MCSLVTCLIYETVNLQSRKQKCLIYETVNLQSRKQCLIYETVNLQSRKHVFNLRDCECAVSLNCLIYETVNLQSRKTGGNKREPNATSKNRTIGSQCTVCSQTCTRAGSWARWWGATQYYHSWGHAGGRQSMPGDHSFNL